MGGAKMSSSKGNTVSAIETVDRYGADTARAYVCFLGPPDRGGDWVPEGVEGVHRFLVRLWRLAGEVAERTERRAASAQRRRRERRRATCSQRPTGRSTRSPATSRRLPAPHRDRRRDGARQRRLPAQGLASTAIPRARPALRFATATAASLIFPFAPHLGSEVYDELTGERVWEQPWPQADESLLDQRRVHARRPGQRQAPRPDRRPRRRARGRAARARARERERRRHLDGKEIVKEIVVPGKLVNLVVR